MSTPLDPRPSEPTGPRTDAAALVARAKAMSVDVELEAAEQLLAYLDAMLVVNEHVNLTGVRDREQAVVLHALDSLAFARTGLRPLHALDLGTGNGFPGVGVAALHRRASVVLMDRTAKKIRAIGTCLLTARVQGIETMTVDAAQAPSLHKEMRAAFDVVTARAVGQPQELALLAKPFLKHGGSLVLWLDADTPAPSELEGMRRQAEVGYDLPEPAARHRRLAVYRRG